MAYKRKRVWKKRIKVECLYTYRSESLRERETAVGERENRYVYRRKGAKERPPAGPASMYECVARWRRAYNRCGYNTSRSHSPAPLLKPGQFEIFWLGFFISCCDRSRKEPTGLLLCVGRLYTYIVQCMYRIYWLYRIEKPMARV
jgi:hypothetical protein